MLRRRLDTGEAEMARRTAEGGPWSLDDSGARQARSKPRTHFEIGGLNGRSHDLLRVARGCTIETGSVRAESRKTCRRTVHALATIRNATSSV